MIARLVMFNVIPSLFGFVTAFVAVAVRIRPKKERWVKASRIAKSVVVVLVGLVPLFKVIVTGPELLVGTGELAFSICLAVAWLLAALIVLWRSLRAPQMSHEEFKKNKRWRFLICYVTGFLLILACGGIAWLHGRSTGLRALNEAAAEAREVIESRQKDGSPETAAAYLALFKELNADKGLDHASERRSQDKRLPEGEERSGFVGERRELIKRIEKLCSGPAPAFGLRHLGTGPEPGRGVYGGFRGAAMLLTLASRQAAAEGNGARALVICRVRLRLAEHLGHSPGWLAWMVANSVSRANPETLGICLTAAKEVGRSELALYARELAERRRAAGKTLAVAMLEDTASRLIWQQEIVARPKAADEDDAAIGKMLYWWILPYYGGDSVPGILPRARRFSRALTLREEEARVEARRLDEEAEAQPSFAALCLTFDAFLVRTRAVNSRMGAERFLGRREAACALRLHALDSGEYPEKLAELAPKHLDAAALDLVLKAKTKYERTKTGCRLYWPVKSCDAKKTIEILLGPRPPAKKKPPMKPDVNYVPRSKPLGH